MVKRMTVSCVSGPALQFPPSTSYEEIVDRTGEHWRQRLAAVAPDAPDLIVLPEAVDRPDPATFSVDRQREYFAFRGERILDLLAETAASLSTYLAYSSQVPTADGQVRNSTYLIDRTGQVVSRYDKNFLVIEEFTETKIAYGTQIGLAETEFGRVGSIICFDLNFTELLAQYRRERPRLLLFSSEYHGGLMQQYWAYSARAYLAGSIRPPAPCSVVSPLGEVVASSTNYFDRVSTSINLDYAVVHLDSLFPLLDRVRTTYGPALRIHDPGLLGSVLLSSETEDFTTEEVLEAEGIEPLDAYLERSRRAREEGLALPAS